MVTLFDGTTGPLPAGTRITQPYGYDPDYPSADHFHKGTDFGVVTGTLTTYPRNLPDAVVVIAGPFGGYGTCMVVRFIDAQGTRWYLLWGHMLRLRYSVGATVRAGDVVGETDNTGYSFGAHCHFGVGRESYYGGGWVDPLPWLRVYTAPPATTEQEQLEMTFSDTELANLHRQARNGAVEAVEWAEAFRGFLSPLGFAARDASFDSAHDPGTPMNPVAIGIRRATELFMALQLTKDQIAALPEPKYTTLKKWLIDLQEQAQED